MYTQLQRNALRHQWTHIAASIDAMRANVAIPFFIQSLRNLGKLRTGMTRFVQAVSTCKQLISYHDTIYSNGLILGIHSALVADTLEKCKQSPSAMTNTSTHASVNNTSLRLQSNRKQKSRQETMSLNPLSTSTKHNIKVTPF
ncbi:hypothetical protein TRVL_08428 [Trypanosoma vivax]|nr:hypothetical protein TRVL_08428 [Trypanosoma vivax]